MVMIATTHRHVFKQTGKQADTHTRIQADRQTDRHTNTYSSRQANRHTHIHVFKQRGKQTDTQTRIQADRQTDRQKRRTSAKLLNAEHRHNYNRYRVLRRRPDAKYGLLLNVVIPSSKRAKVCTTVYYVTAVEYSSMLVRTYTMYLQ